MKLLKNLIKEKNFGFYVTLAFGLLMLITGIIYAVNFQSEFTVLYAHIPYNVWISVLLILGAILTIGLSIHRYTANYAPLFGGVCVLTTLCLFIKDAYNFIANCFIDIDYHIEDFYNPIFLTSLIFIIITFVVAIVACFLPQLKKVKETNEGMEGAKVDEK